MSNYQRVAYEDACDDLKSVYEDVQIRMGSKELPNWLTYLGEVPQVLKGTWSLLKSVLIEGGLSPLLQDLILYTVAYHRTVPYCMALHGNNLIRMSQGLTFSQLDEIATGKSRGFIPHKFEVATEIAAKLATSDCSLCESDFNRLLDVGFSREEAIEITMLVSVGLFLNTYTFAANLPVDESLEPN